MKLELKHLAGYLPYRLKVYVYGQTRFENCICELKWLDASNQAFFDGDWNNISDNSEYFKPILRPLSELTKEELNMFSIDFKVMVKSKRKIDIKNYLTLNDSEWLFENHFDIYGLIENNLAIDKNTIS